MHTERHVRLFRNGRNQAIRIPREFELEGLPVLKRYSSLVKLPV
jgi:antitoxin VapB